MLSNNHIILLRKLRNDLASLFIVYEETLDEGLGEACMEFCFKELGIDIRAEYLKAYGSEVIIAF